jgi:hypothetical protein
MIEGHVSYLNHERDARYMDVSPFNLCLPTRYQSLVPPCLIYIMSTNFQTHDVQLVHRFQTAYCSTRLFFLLHRVAVCTRAHRCEGRRVPVEKILLIFFFVPLSTRETHTHNACPLFLICEMHSHEACRLLT